MAYNIGLKTTTFGGEVNFLDSQQTRSVRGGVTLDASAVTADGNGVKKLLAGTFIGKVAASGKWVQADGTTPEGVTPTLILAEDVDFTSYTESGGLAYADQVATAYDQARVIAARLSVAPTAAVKAGMPGITFV
jgi:hypothetical protein